MFAIIQASYVFYLITEGLGFHLLQSFFHRLDLNKRTKLKSDERQFFDKMEYVEDYIAENEMLPDDLLALLCTSKHKGCGINPG